MDSIFDPHRPYQTFHRDFRPHFNQFLRLIFGNSNGLPFQGGSAAHLPYLLYLDII